MTYGLEVTGPNDSFVLDSKLAGSSYMTVVLGSTSVSDGGTYSTAGYTLGDIIYARPSTGAGTIFCDFTNPSNPKAVGDQKFILLRPSATAPSTTQNGSAYGLKVLQPGHVSSATITSGGSGYSSAPAVTIAAPSSGTTATGTATISSGSVTGITITEEGKGYTSVPSITIAGPGGVGSTATATAVLGYRTMYDSRHTASGFDIKASKGVGGCPGGVSGYNGSPTESTANQVYTSFGSNTYALMNGMASLTQGFMSIYLGYNFKSGTTIIYWAGWYQYSGFGNTGFGPLANFGTIMVGDLIT